MLVLHSMPSWLFDAVVLAFGSWVLWRQFRRGNYWIASGLIATIAAVAAFTRVPPGFLEGLGSEVAPLALRLQRSVNYDRFIATALLIVALFQFGFDFITRRVEKLSSNTSSEDPKEQIIRSKLAANEFSNNRRDMLKLIPRPMDYGLSGEIVKQQRNRTGFGLG